MARFPLAARTVARAALLGLAVTVGLSACGESKGTISAVRTSPPATATTPAAGSSSSAPAPASSPKPSVKAAPVASASQKPAAGAKLVDSDVSQLRSLGVQLDESVLIDVADDGLDRYLEIGKDGVIDFTGTGKTPETQMNLEAAKVTKQTESTKNRVVIAPEFWNEDPADGSCIADTAPGVLRLATCKAGTANQTWEVVPAGDSGQFELHGLHTEIKVEKGKITTTGQGYVGLQTIDFVE